MQLVFDIGKELKLGGQTGIGQAGGYGSIGQLISVILPNVYTIAGVILLIILIFGGFKLITTAGGSPEEAAQGKKAITAAIIGFAIIFGSYWLIQIVETITGVNILGGGGL